MSKINKVVAREIIDSRGNPTVEVDVITDTGAFGRGMVPSGASTGKFEALELRDKEKSYLGKGVKKALTNVKELITPKIMGLDVTELSSIDNLMLELDGTENKSKLGANAMLAVSLAVCKAGAQSLNQPVYKYLNPEAQYLPVPMLNVINGGKHAGGNLKIQEFMLIPHGFSTFREALQSSCEIYQVLKGELKKISPSAINVGDEGGFAPSLDTAPQALEILVKAIEQAGYQPDKEVTLGLDCAASEFYENGTYNLDGKNFNADELSDYYVELAKSFPITSIEDPFDESDFEAFAILKKKNPTLAIVADDLTVTNPIRIKMAIEKQSANYLLTKVNQIGTITESINAVDLARTDNWGIVISHRSGETEDAFISDLAVALSAEKIKTGAPARGERTAKYNQLLRIEEELGEKAIYRNIR